MDLGSCQAVFSITKLEFTAHGAPKASYLLTPRRPGRASHFWGRGPKFMGYGVEGAGGGVVLLIFTGIGMGEGGEL